MLRTLVTVVNATTKGFEVYQLFLFHGTCQGQRMSSSAVTEPEHKYGVSVFHYPFNVPAQLSKPGVSELPA